MKTTIMVTFTTFMLLVPSSFAADAKVTREDRQSIAEMHTKMAECLKSDKPISDCRREMMKSYSGIMGSRGHMMTGKDGHQMMMGCMNGMEDMNGMKNGGMMNHDN